ncbi:MAG TPA: FHA domain-containing protein [Thermoanaerobaculia bacterium]|nr:FHA domain-containing protein [Thermoanaerobaculia bacterium]
MPLIRCSRCSQAYDVPGAVAVRLPNSIATCHCGEWLAGSKAAILARMLSPDEIREVDLQPYRVDGSLAVTAETALSGAAAAAASRPRSVRIIARGAHQAIDSVFTIREHPLWIGRQGCHVELTDAELSIRHCSIVVSGEKLIVRDETSHTGTFMDGQEISEAEIGDGVHLLRVGSALVTIEPTEGPGIAVEPIVIGDASGSVIDLFQTRAHQAVAASSSRSVLVCVEGALAGQEFEIPPGGLVVGREGHVKVPDEFLSRKHFEVTADADGTVRVRDLGSRNGTFLNTLPARNTRVHTGDEIKAGVNRFRVELR